MGWEGGGGGVVAQRHGFKRRGGGLPSVKNEAFACQPLRLEMPHEMPTLTFFFASSFLQTEKNKVMQTTQPLAAAISGSKGKQDQLTNKLLSSGVASDTVSLDTLPLK